MSRIASFRPTAPMILACLALFVALGGGAYAAKAKLKPNSVKSKHVKDNSLTGNDINEATLNGAEIPGIPAAGGAVADGAGNGPAGGDLTGNYPNPTIGANAVSGAEVANNSLNSEDINAGPALIGAGDSTHASAVLGLDNSYTGNNVVSNAVTVGTGSDSWDAVATINLQTTGANDIPRCRLISNVTGTSDAAIPESEVLVSNAQNDLATMTLVAQLADPVPSPLVITRVQCRSNSGAAFVDVSNATLVQHTLGAGG